VQRRRRSRRRWRRRQKKKKLKTWSDTINLLGVFHFLPGT
jgi:hypothetical protein